MLFDILCNCIGFQVVDDFHLQVSGLLGFFTRFGVFNRFAFSHHQDLGLFLASTAAFQRFLLLFNGYLGGKEGVVQLDGPSSVYLSSRLPITSRSLLTISHMGW